MARRDSGGRQCGEGKRRGKDRQVAESRTGWEVEGVRVRMAGWMGKGKGGWLAG